MWDIGPWDMEHVVCLLANYNEKNACPNYPTPHPSGERRGSYGDWLPHAARGMINEGSETQKTSIHQTSAVTCVVAVLAGGADRACGKARLHTRGYSKRRRFNSSCAHDLATSLWACECCRIRRIW